MAKRSYTKKSSELTPPEEELVLYDSEDAEVPVIEEELQPEYTNLVLMKDLKLNIKGPVTGTLYVFSGAGAVVPVLNEDVEGLLKKKNPNNCCSGTLQQPYFSIE